MRWDWDIRKREGHAEPTAVLGGSKLGASTLLLRRGWGSHRRGLGLFRARLRGGRRSGGGTGLGELEEAVADLLGVGLEDLYPVLQGSRGCAGGLRCGGEGLGLDGGGGTLGLMLREGAVALGEDAGRGQGLHDPAHHDVARVLLRRPDAERWEQRLRAGLLRGRRRGGGGGVDGGLGGRRVGALGAGVGGVLRHGGVESEEECGDREAMGRDLWRVVGGERGVRSGELALVWWCGGVREEIVRGAWWWCARA